MPDIAATRPVSGQAIETAWGDQVHDAVEGIQAGSVSIVAAAGNGSALITFPRAYASPPIVVAVVGTSGFFFAAVSAVTTTNFLAYIKDIRDAQAGTGTFPVNWVAIGTPA